MFNYLLLFWGLFTFIMNVAVLFDASVQKTVAVRFIHGALASLGGVLIAASIVESFP